MSGLYISKLWIWKRGVRMDFTHFDTNGNAVMVDVTDKAVTDREATAGGRIKVSPEVYQAIRNGTSKKGDVLGVARIAGIMAVKQTANLIPLCHTLQITKADMEFRMLDETREVEAVCTVEVSGKTGVEMEALTGASVALLTIYDMCKAIDKYMEIGNIHLCKKTGGKSGVFVNMGRSEEINHERPVPEANKLSSDICNGQV